MASRNSAGVDKVANATAVYQHYARLMNIGPDGLGGRMLLVVDAGPSARSHLASSADVATLVRAGNIAGAATLLVCGDSPLARDQVRSGVCDFLVTTLDEALRILKNELRRKLPVAVCLLAEPSLVLRECVGRGAQPDLFDPRHLPPGVAETFAQRGARIVSASNGNSPGDPPPDSNGLDSQASAMRMVSWTAPARGALLAVDALVLDTLRATSQHLERHRWLARAPQYLLRELGSAAQLTHTVPMHSQEAAGLLETVLLAIQQQRLPRGIGLRSGDEILL